MGPAPVPRWDTVQASSPRGRRVRGLIATPLFICTARPCHWAGAISVLPNGPSSVLVPLLRIFCTCRVQREMRSATPRAVGDVLFIFHLLSCARTLHGHVFCITWPVLLLGGLSKASARLIAHDAACWQLVPRLQKDEPLFRSQVCSEFIAQSKSAPSRSPKSAPSISLSSRINYWHRLRLVTRGSHLVASVTPHKAGTLLPVLGGQHKAPKHVWVGGGVGERYPGRKRNPG